MVVLEQASTPGHLSTIRALFREYASALGVDLSFQGFEEELQDLPGDYVPPRGALILAHVAQAVVGCVAVRPLDPVTAEMKRLYVRPEGRGQGVGRALALAGIEHARKAEYQRMRLDTLPQMAEAQALYHALGFKPIPPYRHNPVRGTVYMEMRLSSERP